MKNTIILFVLVCFSFVAAKQMVVFTKEGPFKRDLSSLDSVKITGQDSGRVFTLFPIGTPASPALSSIDSIRFCDTTAQFFSLPLGDPAGKPVCVRKVEFTNYGSKLVRYGDLNGDGESDALLVQLNTNAICLTAITLEGAILWQNGTPDPTTGKKNLSRDYAIQIYDIDGDSVNEVLYVDDGLTLHILNGKTGVQERSAPVAGNNAMIIANLSGTPFPRNILVKDEYSRIWAYDSNFTLLWSRGYNTGHFPMPFDFDGDGKDEVMCGQRLLNSNGTYRWTDTTWNKAIDLDGASRHADAIDIDDMDNDGVAEIAIACSGPAALVSANGQTLWNKSSMTHAQHACIGAFSNILPGKQAAYVDRVDYNSDPRGGSVYCYAKNGVEVFRTSPQGWLTMAMTIDGWTAESGRSYLILFRRAYGPPVLVNGKGEQVAEFPFPPRKEDTGDAPPYYPYLPGLDFVQHFDVLGDSREEVLVNNGVAIWVYTNGDTAPGLPIPTRRIQDKRIYNSSAYTGMQ